MARADEALYRAKAEGRDRVAVAPQPALRAA
jgi:PleD family two-component response regulator